MYRSLIIINALRWWINHRIQKLGSHWLLKWNKRLHTHTPSKRERQMFGCTFGWMKPYLIIAGIRSFSAFLYNNTHTNVPFNRRCRRRHCHCFTESDFFCKLHSYSYTSLVSQYIKASIMISYSIHIFFTFSISLARSFTPQNQTHAQNIFRNVLNENIFC